VTPSFEEPQDLAPGKYRAQIIGCEQKTSKKGNAYLNWKFEEQSTHAWVYLMTGLSGRGAQMLKQLVQSAGWKHYQDGPINTDELMGRILTIQVDRLMNPDGTPGKYLQIIDVGPDEGTGQGDFDDFH